MNWTDGPIEDLQEERLTRHADERGWLMECYRVDELEEAEYPVMAYVSETRSGVVRGPHEHVHQSDYFVFFDGRFEIFLWDDRPNSGTHGHRRVLSAGREHPIALRVPPGVVHAYRNVSDDPALIINCPNKLYAGWNREEEVDEIRHEERENSPYHIPDTPVVSRSDATE